MFINNTKLSHYFHLVINCLLLRSFYNTGRQVYSKSPTHLEYTCFVWKWCNCGWFTLISIISWVCKLVASCQDVGFVSHREKAQANSKWTKWEHWVCLLARCYWGSSNKTKWKRYCVLDNTENFSKQYIWVIFHSSSDWG